jgi:undecaprenyl phosphate-alpha-L-ara4N flippase subunit ArnF
VIVSVVFTSIAQLLFSFVMKQTNADVSNIVTAVFSLPLREFLYLTLGVILYAVSMLVWIVALTRFPVSLAYPMLSISYVIVYVAAIFLPILNEIASLEKTLGVGFVVVGISVLFFDERQGNSNKSSPRE